MILVYDGSYAGFLSAVFHAFERGLHKQKQVPTIIADSIFNGNLFDEVVQVSTERSLAERVQNGLHSILGKRGANDLWRGWLSEQTDIGSVLFAVIVHAFSAGKRTLQDLNHPAVMQLSKVLKKVSRERHRMTAFVRFEEDDRGLFTAVIEPDYNVLPLIADHFRKRYADQHWFIYDNRRHYGIHYDLQCVSEVMRCSDRALGLPEVPVGRSVPEKEYQLLWADYFKHTNIVERANKKLHLQQVPKRYWRFLTEKKAHQSSNP